MLFKYLTTEVKNDLLNWPRSCHGKCESNSNEEALYKDYKSMNLIFPQSKWIWLTVVSADVEMDLVDGCVRGCGNGFGCRNGSEKEDTSNARI